MQYQGSHAFDLNVSSDNTNMTSQSKNGLKKLGNGSKGSDQQMQVLSDQSSQNMA